MYTNYRNHPPTPIKIKQNMKTQSANVNTDHPKWKRYRFYTKSVDDCRPIIFNPAYPWWCSGYAGDESYAIIVAYLPWGEDLWKYWDDAFSVDFTPEEDIVFTDRFPRPKYFIPQ